jgi:DNA invertase Pin-like site-specific DNA recombinase
VTVASDTTSILTSGWVTYLRVSDEDKQTPERSFAMQRQRIEERLLTGSEMPMKREYCDILTGTTPKRADYQQMLADAERGAFSHLALYRADRFGRNAMEGLQAATKLISVGIKIRVANMPSLCPETPDGFFMFMLQMGLAQREVEVLRERTADGMEAKLRAGGWAHKAPAGYLNKEVLVSSNKYHRWVEIDPEYSKVIRLAWDLLLTGRHTLKQICEELTRQGHTRGNGSPWTWTDPMTGARRDAQNTLDKIFHNAFYAGWGVSKRFGIAYGDVRGSWDPIVSSEEFKRGIEILHSHDREKSRSKHRFYLLRGLLWLETGRTLHRMYVSTPRGKKNYYGYYLTHARPGGKQVHLLCDQIDRQIDAWLESMTVNPAFVPGIQKIYMEQISQVQQSDHEEKVARLQQKIRGLRDEELRLGRLLLKGKIAEETYDKLRHEWQETVKQAELDLQDLERDATSFMDDLDVALELLVILPDLYRRLDGKRRAVMLEILAKRIIVNSHGEIVSQELHSPFIYLLSLQKRLEGNDGEARPCPPDAVDPVSAELSVDAPERFLNMVRFEQRRRLAGLLLDIPENKGNDP